MDPLSVSELPSTQLDLFLIVEVRGITIVSLRALWLCTLEAISHLSVV